MVASVPSQMAWLFLRPANSRGDREIFGERFEIAIALGGGPEGKWLENFARVHAIGERGAIFGGQGIVEPLAHQRPSAQVLRACPYQTQHAARKLHDRARFTCQEFIRAWNILFGQHEQKLLGTARAEQHARELQFREQGPWQHFAGEGQPCATSHQVGCGILAFRRLGRQE